MWAKAPVFRRNIELRLFSRSTDGHTDSKQTAHTNEELSSQLHPSRNCRVITIFGWPRIFGCYWRFVIGAEWLQTGFSRERDLARPAAVKVVAFWQVWVGFTSQSSHLAWQPVSHNNTDTLQSRRLESGGPLCLCMSLGSRTMPASFVFGRCVTLLPPASHIRCLIERNSIMRREAVDTSRIKAWESVACL